ncbi:PREDICTED: uncharacterized protein LOC109463328 [Branchiostoma belcheri]|uniref:Uncharacterized protein LOC109463328 n=1 Tax=Branchiostoma belcheri TaxID=7741 RepID=A0A6P4XGK5_BRABE|nr:PREDICTED: uncharacterized protein LOC109463328 [Branchiostoma belcheri]
MRFLQRSSLFLIPILRIVSMLAVLAMFFVSLNAADQELELSKLQVQGCDVTHHPSLPIVCSIYCNNKGLTSIPTDLSKSLFELLLPNNAITVFPCTGLDSLYRLNLRNNNISYVPWHCLKNMTRLTELDLSQNQIFCVNLFPVMPFLTELRLLNVSFNRIFSLPLCDLGIGNANRPTSLSRVMMAGNHFWCSCEVLWMLEVAKKVELCRGRTTVFCTNYFKENIVAIDMLSKPSLFRCSTPSWLAGRELRSLNTRACYTFDKTLRRLVPLHQPKPCRLDNPCHKVYENPFILIHHNVTTSTSLPLTSRRSDLFLTSTFPTPPQAKTRSLSRNLNGFSDGINSTLTAIFTETSDTTFSPVTPDVVCNIYSRSVLATGQTRQILTDTNSTLTLNMAEMTQTLKPSPQPVAVLSGWVVVIAVVVIIAGICGVVFAVYVAMRRGQPCKNVPIGHVNNMAAGQVANSVPSQQVARQNPDVDGCCAGESDSYTYDKACAMSIIFDTPQYHIAELSDEDICNVTENVSETQDSENIYENKNVS